MLNYIETKLEIKSIDLEKRTFRASATGIGNVDYGLDKFMPGAFARTIASKVKAGKVKFVDAHFYKYAEIGRGSVPSQKFILGKLLSAEETPTALLVEIFVSDTVDGNDLLTKIKDGVVDALSVGYIPIKVRYEKEEGGDERIIRLLEEVKLMEVSAVIWGMNDRATIDATSVKNNSDVQNWPLADESTSWDSEEAIDRLKANATGDNGGINFKDYRRFFLQFDGDNAEDAASYKLPYCDVINGKIAAIPEAILAIAANVTDEDTEIKQQLERWYAKMEKETPWSVKALTFQGTLSEEVSQDALWKLFHTFNETLRDIFDSEDKDADEKQLLIEKAFTDYKNAIAELLLDVETAKLTDEKETYIIRANEPLIALLEDSEAHGKPVPPNSKGTRFADEDQVNELATKLRKVKIDQLK